MGWGCSGLWGEELEEVVLVGGGRVLGVVREIRLIFEFAKDGFWIIMGNVM